MSHVIAHFVDNNVEPNPPTIDITTSTAFNVVILTAQTIGDDGEAGAVAPVVMTRREFAQLIGDVLVNADRALKADIEIAAAFAEGFKRRG